MCIRDSSIADIIAMESEVIIFDEPTAALDPLNAAMLEEVLQKMGDEGRTMLISCLLYTSRCV